jgi:hypothetical protein
MLTTDDMLSLMAGPAVHINYISDDGNTYRALVPAWEVAVTGDAAATATVGMPKGYLRRKRKIQDPATGKEYSLTVGDITLASWTAGFGVTVTPAPDIPGHGTVPAVYAGRIGEKDLIRG